MIHEFIRVEADQTGDQQGGLVALQLGRDLLEAHRRRGIAEVHGNLVELGAQLVLSRFELCNRWIGLGTNERIYDIGEIDTGACCGEILPKNDVHTEAPSCDLCPQGAPDDGAPCSLPDDCAPSVIDCFYKCCCYGTTIWAQCDGKRWHVATNCSSK